MNIKNINSSKLTELNFKQVYFRKQLDNFSCVKAK